MWSDELRQRLLSLDTACLCDANKAQRAADDSIPEIRVVDPAIRPIRTGLKLVGIAHTVTCRDDFLTVIKGLRDAEPGEVLVIDAGDSQRAVAGGLFPTEAARKGLAGIVVDGPCRDTGTIRGLELPYYARFATPIAGKTARLFETQVAITCGGVTVNPGDVVVGDDDGLVVASVEEFIESVPLAEEIQRTEGRMLGNMARGTSLMAMLNFEEHCAAIAAGEPSTLRFTV